MRIPSHVYNVAKPGAPPPLDGPEIQAILPIGRNCAPVGWADARVAPPPRAQPMDAGDATCSVDARFDERVLVAGLDAREIDSAHPSDDERCIRERACDLDVEHRRRACTDVVDRFPDDLVPFAERRPSAARSHPSRDPREPLGPVDELRSPASDAPAWPSPDRCRLYFVSDRSSKRALYVATRLP